jgi:hypothetical protein
MKYMPTITIALVLFLGCQGTKRVSYTIHTDLKHGFHYQMDMPKGYAVDKIYYSDEKRMAKVVRYPDSTEVYFTDNISPNPGFFYPDAYRKYGKGISILFAVTDTITINGVDGEGKLWEDRKIKYVVYGYRGVPVNKKEQIDKILNTMRSKPF